MKSRIHKILFALAALASVSLSIGCAPEDKNGGPAPSLSPKAPGPTSSGSLGDEYAPPIVNGTSSSGGGTGIEGKVFESYIVDPTQLPAYKQHLEPLLKNVKSDRSEGMDLGGAFLMKTWYIAPVDLDRVSKDVLGISFMKSDTQQIARQKMNEVWIDKRIFDRMSLPDQSDLLLHELVMSIYFFKFMTMSEICRLSLMFNGEKENDGCVKHADQLDIHMPREEPHPLTDQDNENIRFVTGWIIQNAKKPIAERDLARILYYNGFDKRFFKPSSYEEGPPDHREIKISRKEFFQAVQSAALSGNMPGICVAASSGARQPCKLEFEEKSILYHHTQLPGFNLRLTVEGEPPVDITLFVSDETKFTTWQSDDPKTIIPYYFQDWQSKIQIGDRIYSGSIFFSKDNHSPHAGLVLESVFLRPAIVVSIDKKRDPICQSRAPRVVKFVDDAISIRHENSSISLTEQIHLTTPPVVFCRADNVVE